MHYDANLTVLKLCLQNKGDKFCGLGTIWSGSHKKNILKIFLILLKATWIDHLIVQYA